jgi:SAM-dependent methyltransferase
MCGSARSRAVIYLGAEEIVLANWSYRQDRFADMGIDPKARFGIQKCSECAFVYAGDLPPQDFLAFVYDELIDIEAARHESYSPHNLANRMEYLAFLMRFVSDGDKVLDFGCGFGPTLALLKNAQGIEAVGFETSAARATELEEWHPLIVRTASALQRYGPFNAVILDNVVEHVPDPRQTVNLISNVCAEGAIVYVSVPDISAEYLKSQIYLNQNSKLLGMDVNPWEHLNYFDLAHLDALMNQTGFVALRQSALPGEVRIGLRPEMWRGARLRNSIASMLRGAGYAWTGDALPSVNRRFYQFNGRSLE